MPQAAFGGLAAVPGMISVALLWQQNLAVARETDNTTRRLRQIEDVLALFQPFTHDHYCVFECRSVDRLPVAEPEFRFDPESIEWRSYWPEVHMPGLRRWCFPLYENKEKELYEPAVPFSLRSPAPPAAEHKETA